MQSAKQNIFDLKRTLILLNQGIFAVITSTLAGLFLISVCWRFLQDLPGIYIWIGVYAAFTSLRLYYITGDRLGSITMENFQSFLRLYQASTFVAGTLWCMLFILLFVNTDETYRSVILITAGGLIAGSMGTYTTSYLAHVLFSTPAALLFSLYLMFYLHEPHSGDSGFLLFMCYTFFLLTGYRLHKAAMVAINNEMEKEELLRDLLEEKSIVSKLNLKLQDDLSIRGEIEQKLLYQVEKAETLAQRLQSLSDEDALTEISNRRRFDEALIQEWNRAIRHKTPIALILCDIDFFKNYNDRYGHREGDACLKRVASVLRDNARRSGELAARYGGEEFAIILPEICSQALLDRAEVIRHDVEGLRIVHADSKVAGVITISLGMTSTVPTLETDLEEFINTADRALYRAKSAGRNRTVCIEFAGVCQDAETAELKHTSYGDQAE